MKKFLGGMVVLLLVAGVGIPAMFGYVQQKASDIGVNTLLASSTDENSTYILSKYAEYWDGSNRYGLNVITMEDYDYFQNDKSNLIGSISSIQTFIDYRINISQIENIDKIVFIVGSDDGLTNNTRLIIRTNNGNILFNNPEPLGNSSTKYKYEVEITPTIRLKLMNADSLHLIVDKMKNPDGQNPEGKVYYSRLELYDTQKIDGNMLSDGMLGVSGFLMIFGAFAATPFFNPTQKRKFNFKRG